MACADTRPAPAISASRPPSGCPRRRSSTIVHIEISISMGTYYARYGDSGVVMHQSGNRDAMRKPQSANRIWFNVGTGVTAAAAMDQ